MSKATDILLEQAKVLSQTDENLNPLIIALENLGSNANGNSQEYKDLRIAVEAKGDKTPKDETTLGNKLANMVGLGDKTPKDETPKDETLEDETPKDETLEDETLEDETLEDETEGCRFKKLIKNPVAIGGVSHKTTIITLTDLEVEQNEKELERAVELGLIKEL